MPDQRLSNRLQYFATWLTLNLARIDLAQPLTLPLLPLILSYFLGLLLIRSFLTAPQKCNSRESLYPECAGIFRRPRSSRKQVLLNQCKRIWKATCRKLDRTRFQRDNMSCPAFGRHDCDAESGVANRRTSWYPQLCATDRLQEEARQPISAVLDILLLTTACTKLTRCES